MACVPLPPDVDAAFVFIIRTIPQTDATVQTDVGIRLQDCLDDDFVNTVEHADIKIDASKMFPGGKVAVQRGYVRPASFVLTLRRRLIECPWTVPWGECSAHARGQHGVRRRERLHVRPLAFADGA